MKYFHHLMVLPLKDQDNIVCKFNSSTYWFLQIQEINFIPVKKKKLKSWPSIQTKVSTYAQKRKIFETSPNMQSLLDDCCIIDLKIEMMSVSVTYNRVDKLYCWFRRHLNLFISHLIWKWSHTLSNFFN